MANVDIRTASRCHHALGQVEGLAQILESSGEINRAGAAAAIRASVEVLREQLESEEN